MKKKYVAPQSAQVTLPETEPVDSSTNCEFTESFC